VEVRGYLELRKTFTDDTASRTESIRYLVVNADSAYNILLGRPALNRLRGVSLTRHMKLKLPDLSAKVIVIKFDQKEAKKCYENSLKTKMGIFMVVERPPMEEAPVEIVPMKEMPAEAIPIEEDRISISCTNSAKNARERRLEPVENVVERQIGGKTFKLG